MPEGAAGESEGFWGSGVLGGGRGASLSGPAPRGLFGEAVRPDLRVVKRASDVV
jgi:hypothetical protein